MYISSKDIDYIVRSGGVAKFEYWAYDIVADRLEKTGFRRKSGILCNGPLTMDGSIYCNDRGDKVVVTTHRTVGPITVIKSIPFSEKPENQGTQVNEGEKK